MMRHRKSGVFSSVTSADCHQQTRRAMAASRSESFSPVSADFTLIGCLRSLTDWGSMASFNNFSPFYGKDGKVCDLHFFGIAITFRVITRIHSMSSGTTQSGGIRQQIDQANAAFCRASISASPRAETHARLCQTTPTRPPKPRWMRELTASSFRVTWKRARRSALS